MSTATTNYGLTKPALTEQFSTAVVNANYDLIDAGMRAGAVNRNILHNWDLTNPVNQRGAASYTGAVYGIDRWLCDTATNVVDVQASNVKVSFTGDGSFCQYIEHPTKYIGKTLTASIELASTTVNNVAFRLGDNVGDASYGLLGKTAGIYTVTHTVNSGATILWVDVYGNQLAVTNSVEVSRFKLELGSISTLANDPPADFGEQLLLCQRFWQHHTINTVADMDLRPNMRIASPTKTAITGGYSYSADL